MDFSAPNRKPVGDTLLPMINVVFLLLIFFLIAARMTPPEAIAVTPPQAQAEAEAQGAFTLLIGADGRLAWREAVGDAALSALAEARRAHCATADCAVLPAVLTLRADAALPAAALAALLPRLAALGFAQVEVLAVPGQGR